MNFILEEGTADDRNHILKIVREILDKNAYATTSHEGDMVQRNRQGFLVALDPIIKTRVTFTYVYDNEGIERLRKTKFKLKLKYPKILLQPN